MKKIIFSIIVIIMYFMIFTQVEAAGTVSLSSSKTSINVGDTFTVSINLSGASVATLTARVSFDTSKVDFVSGPSNSNYSSGKVIYTWTDPTGGDSPLTGGTIATFTFKAKAEGNVNFAVSGNFFTSEETSVNPSFSGVTVNVKTVETTTPGGNSGTGTGENTGGETGGNTGTGSDTGTGTGSSQTGGNQSGTGSMGNNTGTSGGNNTGNSGNTTGGTTGGGTGTTTNPPINNNTGTTTNPPTNNNTGAGNNTSNNQQTTKSSNNNLKSLQLDAEGISPAFNKNKTQYYITIPENISNINVTATPEDSKASVQVLGNTNIQVGNSQIKIVVTAENGNKKEYVINVIKTNNPELANANLENLAIENVTLVPEFDSDIIDYTAEVSADIDKLNILAVPQIEAATVSIEGNENLQIGDNFIKVTVLAQDGQTSKVYNIIVKKNESENVVEEVKNDNLNNLEENTNNNGNVENVIENKVKSNNIAWIIGVIILGVLTIGVIVCIVKKKNENNNL